MPGKILLYGNLTCPDVAPARAMLSRAGVEFDYVQVTWDRSAQERVRDINDGNLSLPTVVFADGSTLTEPTREELRQKLLDLGYDARPPSMLDEALVAIQHPLLVVFAAMLLAVGISSGTVWMLSASLVMLAAVGLGAVGARARGLR